MDQTFHTLIHVGAKSEIDELVGLRAQLTKLLGKEFVQKSDQDYSTLNKVVADNIDIKIPGEGEVVKRLVELAQERNIHYIPSHESAVLLNDYCALKGIPVNYPLQCLTLFESDRTRQAAARVRQRQVARFHNTTQLACLGH